MSDKKQRKKGTHCLALLNDYLLGGTAAVEKLWLAGEVSRDTVRKAIKEMEKKDEQRAAALKAWYDGTLGEPGNSIRPGEERVYKAQLTKESSRAFIKLPLWESATKGAEVVVRHPGPGDDNVITVRPSIVPSA